MLMDLAPPDLRFVGRTLLHAALVGLTAGLAGALLFGGLELFQRVLLEGLTGYIPLRAHGERVVASAEGTPFRPWLLVLLPALGGLACGLVTRLATEARGGGGNAMIEAFHERAGIIRRRVIWVKSLASILTLGTGGAGGREGPTMQVGGALGSWVGRLLRVGRRERRILLVAGVAAGMAAVFRTPLGAALLAVEILYRDGFESDALVPSIIASVVAYSVVISIYGETTLLGHAARFPFHPAHLPWYALMALLVAGLAVLFVKALVTVRQLSRRIPVADWARPALGGLALGVLFVPVIVWVGTRIRMPGQGLGILGGGYGAVQMAISGTHWLPGGWTAVALLFLLSLGKLLASSLTIGSGGSAGDFAPSLAIGGLFGGAFGRALQLLLQDPRIDPGAFALVGMGAFYGGIAHVPLSALVLVCELAGNYDLLVPLMLALGVSYAALRGHSLYPAQAESPALSPAHRDHYWGESLKAVRVEKLFQAARPFVTFSPRSTMAEMQNESARSAWQEVFPVVDERAHPHGLVTMATLRSLADDLQSLDWMVAADVMQPPVFVRLRDDMQTAAQRLVANKLRAMPILDDEGHLVGMLDEADVALHCTVDAWDVKSTATGQTSFRTWQQES